MSRGPSPSPLASYPSLASSSISSTTTETPVRPARPARAPLRVETNKSLYPHANNPPPVQSNGNGSLRNRSNSAQSHSPLPVLPSHQFSRSLSHNTVAIASSPISPVNHRNDVAMAVNGLRGMPSHLEHPLERSRSPISPESHSSDPYRHNGAFYNSRPLEHGHGQGTDDKAIREIREALGHSKDEGDTLDLSRRGIQKIGDEAVEMFRKGVGQDMKGVWRLALSYNALHDGSIVDSFSRLNRLRYLNLKGNKFTEFPSALFTIGSLEILDLSKNQIESFPESPGRLSKLKVLSLTRNRIYILPTYLTTFHSLKVFKVDQNPIEWPPREVLGALVDVDYSQADPETGAQRKDEDMRPWIENMKSWMRQRSNEGERLLLQNKEDEAYLASEEEPASAVSVDASSGDKGHWPTGSQASLSAAQSQQTVRAIPVNEELTRAASPFNHRIALNTRNRSATMSDESLNRPTSPGLIPPIRPFVRHDRTLSNASSTPPYSASAASSSSHSRAPSTNLPPPPMINPGGHSRGASYTATQRLSGNISSKKSLPDLRQSHAKIMQDRRNDGQPVEGTRPLGLGINTPAANRYQSLHPWGESPRTPLSANADRPRMMLRKGSADMHRKFSGEMGEAGNKRDSSEDGTMADDSRNSYFRRLSTLPVSTISKGIPPALLNFVEGIRGVLFALTQLHSALRQYLIYAVQSRVSGVFNRVMEPAGTYISNLINALDRFDAMSRRSTPTAAVIKSVIDSTKECVAVFSKIISVLRLQMPALRGGDVRYTRTLLLMIYGSMTEVGTSWTTMEPLLAEITPFLIAARNLGGLSMQATNSMTGRTPISPIPERGESRSPSSVARSSFSTVNASPSQPITSATKALNEGENAEAPLDSASTARAARNRRQGGSFSMEDVEKGMLMVSPGVAPSESSDDNAGPSSYTRHRPSASAQIVLEDQEEESEGEEETLMPLPQPPFAKSSRSGSIGVPITPPEFAQHPQLIAMAPVASTQSRRGHHPSSSAGSLSALPGPLRKLSVDVQPPTPASATLYDEDLLDVIETATDIAFTTWLKLAEDIDASSIAESPVSNLSHGKTPSQGSMSSTSDSMRMANIPPRHHADLIVLLSKAEHITTTLRETLAGIRANPSTWSQSSLPDDAQAFIKIVVKVSESVKAISSSHTFPQAVRQSISRLTQATRECAILIQVSSLRPGAATPAPIPPASARPMSPAYRIQGGRGGRAGGQGQGVSGNGTAESSAEDLTVPHSASSGLWNGLPSAASISSLSGGGSGLRGLQLPSRHAARKRDGGREPPKSAQPGQTVFG